MIPKQTAKFRLGTPDTDTGEKHVRPATLTSAVNVRMNRQRGVYQKAKGFDSVALTYSGGTFSSNGVDSLLPMPNGDLIIYDKSNQVWSKTASGTSYVGAQERPWPSYQTVISSEITAPKSKAVLVGSKVWIFSLPSATTITYTVVDAVTGVTTTAPITITSNGQDMAPVYDGTYVWLFYVDATTEVKLRKFTAADPAAASVLTTYSTVANAVWTSIDAKWMPQAGRVYVAYMGGISPGTSYRCRGYSKLIAATGLKDAESTVVTSFSGAAVFPHIYILDGQVGNESDWYYAYIGHQTTTLNTIQVHLVKVSNSTFTQTGSALAASPGFSAPGTTYTYSGAVSGYCADATNQVVFCNLFSVSTASGDYSRNDNVVTYKTTWVNGAAGSTSTIARGAWIASGTFQIGTSWYFMTGFDDGQVPVVALRKLQQSFHLRDSTGKILAQIAVGSGTGMWSVKTHTTTTRPSIPRVFSTGTVGVDAKAVTAIVVSNASIAYSATASLVIDFCKAYGRPVVAMDRAIIPGPIPVAASATGMHEVVPILLPSWVTATAGGVAVADAVAIRYVIVNQDGTAWRGAPMILTQAMAAAATVTWPTLRHLLPGTSAKVEIYLAAAGAATPKLQSTVANTPTTDTQTYTVPATLVVGESLDTYGGALTQAWPVPCQAAGLWRGRIFLASDNELWYSQEMVDGFGPVFNGVLKTIWAEAGNAAIIGMGRVSWDYMALFTSNAVAVVGGAGPDGLGRGNYQIQPLTTEQGTTYAHSIVAGPDGCYFYDTTAGRLELVTPSLQIVELAGQSRSTFVSDPHGIWWEAERSIVWIVASSSIVLDYGNKTEQSPYGQQYSRSWPSALTGPVAACILGTAPVLMNNAGDYWTVSANYYDTLLGVVSPLLMNVKLAPLQVDDLQGEFSARTVTALFRRFTNTSFVITTYPDYATSGTSVTAAITATAQQFSTNPPGCGRVQSITIEFQETGTPAGTGEGARLEGVALVYQPRGRVKMLNSGQVI